MARVADRGYLRGTVVSLRPNFKQEDGSLVERAYAIQLSPLKFGQPGPVVFAPA
eukprot:CAMPEP_0183370926 /NCGR_PEP_ID=MMETSP0164_2-20130417/103879_1 /TAXON_ID=221442 /ORGANISM="Coccolithus pelagicus ssp braarudi, Strain PLY182g" /LENGTH=53 /DNA_ID=CAMNT_0025547405 /DNA_START=57 /DNA_END=214 /DNA_ORIENTATION=+